MYTPRPAPTHDITALARYVEEELRRLGAELSKVSDVLLVEQNVAPDKPRNGQVALADGTNWNPGSGRGVYWYDGDAAAWKLLG